MQNLTRQIKSEEKIAMDFNVANFVRCKNKALAIKTCNTRIGDKFILKDW